MSAVRRVLPLLLVFAVAATAVAAPAPVCAPKVAPCCEHEGTPPHAIATPSCCHFERAPEATPLAGTPVQLHPVAVAVAPRSRVVAVPRTAPSRAFRPFDHAPPPRGRQYLRLRQLLI